MQLIDATQWFTPLRKNLGQKNCELSQNDIERICDTFVAFEETEESKIFPNADFGYWKVTVERPLKVVGIDAERVYNASEIRELRKTADRADDGFPVIRRIHPSSTQPNPLHGLFATTISHSTAVVEYEPDTDLRDVEQIPLLEEGGIEAFLRREVMPFAPDAWYVRSSLKIGYEINFNRFFYKPQSMRPLEDIRADIIALEQESERLLADLFGT